MDSFNILSNELNLKLRMDIPVEQKEAIIFEFLLSNTQSSIKDFHEGLPWFGTSEPLSLQTHLKGKIVVLDFFTYCCINCMHILPHLKALEENYSIEDGLVIIGVHSAKFDNEKDSINILSAIKRYNITHPVVNDAAGAMWNDLGITCWPTLLILGPNGQPLFQMIGEGHKEELFLYVKCALKHFNAQLSTNSLPLIDCSDVTVQSSVLNYPGKVTCFINEGEELLAISDTGNHRVVICTINGIIKIKVGGNGPGFQDGSYEQSRFNSPQGLVSYSNSTLFVADTENHAIRKIDLVKKNVTTVVGTGVQGTDLIGGRVKQELSSPWDVCVVSNLQFTPSNLLNIIGTKDKAAIAKPPQISFPSVGGLPPPPPPIPVCVKPPSDVFPPNSLLESNNSLKLASPPPPPPIGPPMPPGLPPIHKSSPTNFLSTADILLIAMAGNHQIWALLLDRKESVCVALAGSGTEENRNNRYPLMAGFAQPSGLTYSKSNNVYIADSESSSIRCLSLTDGKVTNIVGGDVVPDNLFSYGDTDGQGHNAKLQHPLGVAFNSHKDVLYVSDSYNHKIKEVNVSQRTCVTLNLLSEESLCEPGGLCLSSAGDKIYVADTNNHCIRVVHIQSLTMNKINLQESVKPTMEEAKTMWDLNTSLNSGGGDLTLKIDLQSDSIHGQWIVEPSPILASQLLKGSIDANPTDIKLTIKACSSKDPVSLFIRFKLIICTPTTCELRQELFKVTISFDVNSPNERTMNVSRSII